VIAYVSLWSVLVAAYFLLSVPYFLMVSGVALFTAKVSGKSEIKKGRLRRVLVLAFLNCGIVLVGSKDAEVGFVSWEVLVPLAVTGLPVILGLLAIRYERRASRSNDSASLH